MLCHESDATNAATGECHPLRQVAELGQADGQGREVDHRRWVEQGEGEQLQVCTSVRRVGGLAFSGLGQLAWRSKPCQAARPNGDQHDPTDQAQRPDERPDELRHAQAGDDGHCGVDQIRRRRAGRGREAGPHSTVEAGLDDEHGNRPDGDCNCEPGDGTGDGSLDHLPNVT